MVYSAAALGGNVGEIGWGANGFRRWGVGWVGGGTQAGGGRGFCWRLVLVDALVGDGGVGMGNKG